MKGLDFMFTYEDVVSACKDRLSVVWKDDSGYVHKPCSIWGDKEGNIKVHPEGFSVISEGGFIFYVKLEQIIEFVVPKPQHPDSQIPPEMWFGHDRWDDRY